MTILKFVSIVLILLVVGFFLGPRPDATTSVSFSPDDIGDDIDGYLAAAEKQVDNITKGAEKEIVWQDPQSKAKTPVSIVYLHGFSATKEEIRPVPDMIASQLGANLYYARLAGHGQTGEDFAKAKLSDWVTDTAEAIEIGHRLGEKTIVIGTSTGATLATWAASKPEFAEKISALVFVSPNFAVQGLSTDMANLPWAEVWMPMLAGRERSWEPANEAQAKWWTHSYPIEAIFPMMSLLKTVEAIDKSTIEVPALFIYSPEDMVIEPSYVTAAQSQWGGQSKAVAVDSKSPSRHVIAGDILDPGNNQLVANTAIEWLGETGF